MNTMDSIISKNQGTTVEVVEETALEHEVNTVDAEEFKVKRPEDTSIKFRNQLDEKDLEAVRKAAPDLAKKMVKDYTFIIDFGAEVMEDLDNVSSRMLEEQKGIKLPEADQAVNGILKELDGYSAKYADPKTRNFFNKIVQKFKGSTYTIKNMVRDAKPIADKLDIAKAEILQMELKLQDNVRRGQELRKVTVKTVDDLVKVLALFEEIIDVSRQEAVAMDNKRKVAEAAGPDSVITWEDKKYTIEEFNEILQNQVNAIGEMEKTWFAWRQKFFIYTANISAIRNIVTTSIGLLRTCHRVRTDAIPAAKHQITAWQQAELANQGAEMANRANEGVDRLIAGASKGMAEAVIKGSEANQRPMLSENTIVAMTEDLKRQFTAMVEAENKGREVRARNLGIMEQSEKAIAQASEEARQALLENAMAVVRENTATSNKSEADDILSILNKG